MSVREDASNDERIVSLFSMSADRGERRAYLDLAQAYRKGQIVPTDLERAYFFARLAELGRVDRAEDLVSELAERLSQETIELVDKEVEERRRLNGI